VSPSWGQSGRGWAAQAHIPALKSLSDDFEITALSTAGANLPTPPQALWRASRVRQTTRTWSTAPTGCSSPVNRGSAITLEAGDWRARCWQRPSSLRYGRSATGWDEARRLAALAKKKGVSPFAGLQARSCARSVPLRRALISKLRFGEVAFHTLIVPEWAWGPRWSRTTPTSRQEKPGATMLRSRSATRGRALLLLGEVRELSATRPCGESPSRLREGERRPWPRMNQVCVTGLLEAGPHSRSHYRGGRSRGTNLMWEINGAEGDLRFTAPGGPGPDLRDDRPRRQGPQSRSSSYPVQTRIGVAAAARPFHQLRPGVCAFRPRLSRRNPFLPTFDDAVTRHRMLEAIETAAATGRRQRRGLPPSVPLRRGPAGTAP